MGLVKATFRGSLERARASFVSLYAPNGLACQTAFFASKACRWTLFDRPMSPYRHPLACWTTLLLALRRIEY